MRAILRPRYFYSLSDSKVCALNDMHDQHRQGRTMHGVLWTHVTIKWRHQTRMHIMRSSNLLFRSQEIDRLSYLQDMVSIALILQAGSSLGEAARPAWMFRKGKGEESDSSFTSEKSGESRMALIRNVFFRAVAQAG
jgi:hypothetical protein